MARLLAKSRTRRPAPGLRLVGFALGMLFVAACSKSVPQEVQALIDTQRGDAVKAADAAVLVCPSWKDRSGVTGKVPVDVPEPKTTHPAKGTTLESEAKVKEVFVDCAWPDPRSDGVSSGLSTPALKGSNTKKSRPVTMADDFAMNTCKDGVVDCEQVIVPSRYATEERSADLVIVRALADGGVATTTVVIVP